jgi:hypothetical protein
MKSPLLVLLAATVLGFARPEFSHAQAQQPSLTTDPSPPVADQPFTVHATFLGASRPRTFSYLYSATAAPGSGYDEDLVANGFPDQPLQWGTQDVTFPGMVAGSYVLHFSTYDPYFEEDYASFPILIPKNLAATVTPLPALPAGGLAIIAFLICLYGCREVRR